MYSLLLYIFALHVSGAICTHPQECKLQSTAIGMCNSYGMLIHWSRYWLGHPHTFNAVKFGLVRAKSVRVSQPLPAPMD
jgi:glycosylphosphatidylinositol transamidase (GPIT) subunit GPI8